MAKSNSYHSSSDLSINFDELVQKATAPVLAGQAPQLEDVSRLLFDKPASECSSEDMQDVLEWMSSIVAERWNEVETRISNHLSGLNPDDFNFLEGLGISW